MPRLTLCVVPLVALLLGGCGDSDRRLPREEPPATASPADVVRLWLDAAKRGDASAMYGLYTEEGRRREKADSDTYTGEVASGALRAESCGDLKSWSEDGEERQVTGHVVFRGADGVVHPENLEFRLVRRGGRWWIAAILDYD
jgi:hypothetical protein